MGILTRFKDIMSSNINALLDKAEDPEKMLDQYLRNLNSDLGKVKAETASVMASEAKAKRELDTCNEEIDKMQRYAVKAVEAGNEADARQFLEKKQQLTTKQAALQQQYDTSKANAEKMQQMHDKLVKDISAMEERRDTIKAKMKVAEAQKKINKLAGGVDTESSISAFERMEEKANRMMDEAEAEASLSAPETDPTEDLMAKYDDTDAQAAASVDDELAALKASLGK